MPGHKRKTGYSTDITEITGYDNLHDPHGIIRESMDNLKEIYHTRESWYLVNGSTVGILAAVSAVCGPGDKIVIARNCHKAVYHAIRLLRLEALYLYPRYHPRYDFALDMGREGLEQLDRILAGTEGIKMVVLTSPTYEGIVSDIAAFRDLISRYDDRIVLLADEAHGAHFPFHEAFPASALERGADLVVQSCHKTLPALTQTALLHLCSERVRREALADWLAVYETSSPSYVLMASAEASVIFMHNRGKKLRKYVDNLRAFRKKCGQLLHICLISGEKLPVYDYDMGKLVFCIKGEKQGGKWLFEKLRDQWNIELEMENLSYAIAMTSVMDEEEDFEYLFDALSALDRELGARPGPAAVREPDALCGGGQVREPEAPSCGRSGQSDAERAAPAGSLAVTPVKAVKVMEAWEALEIRSRDLALSESAGRTAASYVMIYPPGIPLLVPGEKIMKEMVENLKLYLYNGYNVPGLHGDKIPVLEEDGGEKWEK